MEPIEVAAKAARLRAGLHEYTAMRDAEKETGDGDWVDVARATIAAFVNALTDDSIGFMIQDNHHEDGFVDVVAARAALIATIEAHDDQ